MKDSRFNFGEPRVAKSAFVHESSTLIGDAVISDDCSIWPQAVVRADVNSIQVGPRSNIQDSAVIHVTHKSTTNPKGWPVNIGSDVTIGHKACLHGCDIGNEVLIGIGAIVLDGAKVQDQVVVAAGALVAPGKVLESGYLYVGSPAKKVRPLTASEKAFFKYSAQMYIDLKNSY